MAIRTPEIKRWPESPVPPTPRRLYLAVERDPEKKQSIEFALTFLSRIAEQYDQPDHELIFGYPPGRIRAEVMRPVQFFTEKLATALAPYKAEDVSWEGALREAGNSVVEKVKLLDPKRYSDFRLIMAKAHDLVGTRSIDRSGMEWDIARAAGWAVVGEQQDNPYISLLYIEGLLPKRLGFRYVQEGSSRVEEKLVTDFRMDLGIEDSSVACIVNLMVEKGKRRGALYFHDIGEDCREAEYFVRYLRQMF